MVKAAAEDDDPPVLTDRELRMMGTLLGAESRGQKWCVFHGAWAEDVGRLKASEFIAADSLNRIRLTSKGQQVTTALRRIGAVKDYGKS